MIFIYIYIYIYIYSLQKLHGIQIDSSSRHKGTEMEVEVLTIRIEYFRKRLDGISHEVTDFIMNKVASELVGEKNFKKWVKDLLQIIPELKKFGAKEVSKTKKRHIRKIILKLEI